MPLHALLPLPADFHSTINASELYRIIDLHFDVFVIVGNRISYVLSHMFTCVYVRCLICGKIVQSRQALCGAGRQPRHVLRYLDCCCCFCFLISWFIDYRIERHAYEIVNSKQIVVGGLHYNNYK